MSYDLLIKNGTVVDGTGAPARRADVAVADGIIAEVGKVKDGAKRVIDASDLHVAPGFVDPHTHYDAQICWDPGISSSSWHGVTTVVMGNCGVGIAPCRPETHEIAAWDLVNVEGIPFDALSKGITWDWETFPQYLDAAERRGSAINLGFLAPLTPFRHYVMGEASMERAASSEETAEIKRALTSALKAGALGFSTSIAPVHVGYKGRPLACRNASRDEYRAYANALKELGSGVIEISLTKTVSVLDDDEYDLADFLLTESGRPLTWLALINRDDLPEACLDSIRKAEPLWRRGAIPQVSNRPVTVGVDLRNPELFYNLEVCVALLNQPMEVQAKIYRDPKFRTEFRAALKGPKALFHGQWEQMTVKETYKPAMKDLERRTVAEIAAERGGDPLDTFLDLALEDDMRLTYSMELFNAVEARTAELITDPRTMIGLSDGGAHVDLLCDAGYCTYLLGTWVRERQVMSLEHAVKRITSEPADFFGLRSRGRLQAGLAADVTVFDYNTIGSDRAGEMRSDLPGGGRRLVMPSRGIQYTIVNGKVLYQDGKGSGDLPGRILRSGNC